MTDEVSDPDLNVRDLTTIIEEFTTIFIRFPLVERLSFTTLSVLHTLSRKGPMRLTELMATEHMTQPAITHMVKRLEDDGLVERRADPHDGRAVLIQLTARGAQIIEAHRLALWSGSPACSTACQEKNARPLQPLCQLWPMRSNWREPRSSRYTRVFPQAPNRLQHTEKKRSKRLCLKARKVPL